MATGTKSTKTMKVDDVITTVTGTIFGNGRSKGERGKGKVAGEAIVPQETPKREGPALGPLVKVKLAELMPHPDNVERTKEEIADMAESLGVDHQREPIVFRTLASGTKQILSGHRRYFGALKLGWTDLDGRERLDCDDAHGLEELAAYNGQRKDIDVIEKAKLIRKLCLPLSEEGSGKTREQAAKIVGVKDHSTASNLVRLLELPHYWLQLVKSGELPWTYARELLPYAKSQLLMGKFFDTYLRDKQDAYEFENSWSTRTIVEDTLENLARANTRPLSLRWYGRQEFDGAAKYEGTYASLIDLDEDLEHKLQIIELENGAKKKERFACNVELFDKLQRDAIKRHVDAKLAKEEAKAAKQGTAVRDKGQGKAAEKTKAGKREEEKLSPSQVKEKADERKAQLDRQLEAWRQSVMRYFVAAALEDLPWLAHKTILYWLTYHPFKTNWQGVVDHSLSAQTKRPGLKDVQRKLDAISNQYTADDSATLVAQTLLRGNAHTQPAEVETVVLAAWLEDAKLDLAECWDTIQSHSPPNLPPLFADFFEIFRKEELLAFGKEFDVFLGETMPKGQMVKLLTTQARTLPLPKILGGKGLGARDHGPAKKRKK